MAKFSKKVESKVEVTSHPFVSPETDGPKIIAALVSTIKQNDTSKRAQPFARKGLISYTGLNNIPPSLEHNSEPQSSLTRRRRSQIEGKVHPSLTADECSASPEIKDGDIGQ